MSGVTKTVIVSSFVDLLKRFVKDLHAAYGDRYSDLESLRNSVIVFANMFPDMCVRIFNEQVSHPYSHLIEKRDESFFLSDAFLDSVKDKVRTNGAYIESIVSAAAGVSHQSSDEIRAVLGLVREAWVDMLDADKNKVWMYLNGLVVLCKRYEQGSTIERGISASS